MSIATRAATKTIARAVPSTAKAVPAKAVPARVPASAKTAPATKTAAKGRVVRASDITKPTISAETIAEQIANGLTEFVSGNDVLLNKAKNNRTWIIKSEIPNVPKPRQAVEITVLVSKADRIRVNLAVLNTNDVFNAGTRVFDNDSSVLDFVAALADNDIKTAAGIATRPGTTGDVHDED